MVPIPNILVSNQVCLKGLFLVLYCFLFISMILNKISNLTKIFADDTMLFSVVKDPKISANELNHDFDIIRKWAHQWKLEFNPDPNKQATEVLFSCKKSSPNHPQIVFNGTIVAKINEQKQLGLILDSILSFGKHVNEKMLKRILELLNTFLVFYHSRH